MSLITFRADTRRWLESNCPPSMRGVASDDDTIGGGKRQRFDNPEAKVWLDAMAKKGWTAPTWPAEYGGGGLTTDEARVLQEEMLAIQAKPAIQGMGFSMIGPTLLDFGTEAQKAEHLSKIVSGRSDGARV